MKRSFLTTLRGFGLALGAIGAGVGSCLVVIGLFYVIGLGHDLAERVGGPVGTFLYFVAALFLAVWGIVYLVQDFREERRAERRVSDG